MIFMNGICPIPHPELLKAGIRKNQILFLNFEDDRLLEFAVGHFQEILCMG
jgi:hypothetical protein